jgi:hypothetical protein
VNISGGGGSDGWVTISPWLLSSLFPIRGPVRGVGDGGDLQDPVPARAGGQQQVVQSSAEYQRQFYRNDPKRKAYFDCIETRQKAVEEELSKSINDALQRATSGPSAEDSSGYAIAIATVLLTKGSPAGIALSLGGPFLARVLAADYRLLKAENRKQQQLKDIRKDCANQHQPVFD